MMLTFIMIMLYLCGMIFTVRRMVYEIKLHNENRTVAGVSLGPRLYSRRDYATFHQDLMNRGLLEDRSRFEPWNRGRLDQYSSDYTTVVAAGAFFPVFWTWILIGVLFRLLFVDTVKRTEGEIQEERERQEEEVRRLYEETERLREEQDGL